MTQCSFPLIQAVQMCNVTLYYCFVNYADKVECTLKTNQPKNNTHFNLVYCFCFSHKMRSFAILLTAKQAVHKMRLRQGAEEFHKQIAALTIQLAWRKYIRYKQLVQIRHKHNNLCSEIGIYALCAISKSSLTLLKCKRGC